MHSKSEVGEKGEKDVCSEGRYSGGGTRGEERGGEVGVRERR